MVFIETPTSRAAWKTAAGAAETRAGSIPHAAHPIPFDGSRTYPIRQKATQPPISTLADRPGSATPARAWGHPKQESYSSPSCILCSIPGRTRFPGRFQDNALKCGMRPRIYRSPTRCFGACGTAARRLPGTPVGDTPNCARFQGCEPEKVGSGRRDLVKPLCHLLGFRVSGYPTSSSWQTHLVLAADW